jgi:SAM-dependent methyltransferase
MIKKVLRKSKKLYHRFLLRHPKNVRCNLCGWSGNRFFDTGWHKHVQCPECNAQIRQRIFWASVNEMNDGDLKGILKDKDVLHFAPEVKLGQLIEAQCRSYKTADLQSEEVSYEHIDYPVDVSHMPTVPDNAFDIVLLFDVLEHVPRHLDALKEVNRVLRAGGYLITTVPQEDSLTKTIEDPDLIDRKKREELFGDPNHVRIYGDDFINFLEDAGFQVTTINSDSFPTTLREQLVLSPPVLSNRRFATNNRRIYFAKLPS